MSARSNGVEWVETAEEVVVTEESLPAENSSPAVIPVLEAAETPIQKLLDTVGHGDNPEGENGFYCEECLTLFQDQSDPDNINGPSFIIDFPTSVGVPQRALLTLPYGLMVGRSSIPCAGVGVINHGPVVSPGMHFGPYEGEMTTRENAMSSDFSWEIYKGKDEHEYIDAAKESHSNWMRYVNCARNKDETNLLAVQYKGSILFHCCRTILTGDELLVWPSSRLLNHSSEAWAQMWFLKLNAAENSDSSTSQIFLCSICPLSFTTEAFLQRHAQCFHAQNKAAECEDQTSAADSVQPAASLVVLSVDSVDAKTCDDCGKSFKQIPHLRRHKLCVHSNRRPYCCPHCRRSFSQASGLIRHQLVHRKQAVIKAPHDDQLLGEEESEMARLELFNAADPSATEDVKELNGSETLQEAVDVADAANTSADEAETAQWSCSDCSKSFTNEASLKKHKVTVHQRLRPYVCTVCQKCFGQYNDLTRHLQRHQKHSKRRGTADEDPEDSASMMPFSCAECSLAFPSVENLQQHINQLHSEDAAAEQQQESTLNLPTQRPQRLRARSKVSAITKLIAPKRKASERSSEPDDKLTKYKWFSCNRCKQTYANPDDLKAHRCTLKSGFLKRREATVQLKSKPSSCERCGKTFTTSGNLKQHQKSNSCMKYHCSTELFPCSFCQFSFTVKSYLVKHVKRHHPVEFLSHCDSDGFLEQLEEEEEEEEEVQKEFTCPQCGKTCGDTKAFKSHTCFRQVKVLYLCTECGKGFTNHYGLKQHQRVHTGEKPYSCPHCSKSFSYVGQLNVHLRTHTGEKPYLCTHCGESFRQSGDLKRHERKHTGVKPYSCPECSKSFSRPQSLKAHQMLHLGQKMFKCTQCGKSFSRSYHLRRHHQKMHM